MVAVVTRSTAKTATLLLRLLLTTSIAATAPGTVSLAITPHRSSWVVSKLPVLILQFRKVTVENVLRFVEVLAFEESAAAMRAVILVSNDPRL